MVIILNLLSIWLLNQSEFAAYILFAAIVKTSLKYVRQVHL